MRKLFDKFWATPDEEKEEKLGGKGVITDSLTDLYDEDTEAKGYVWVLNGYPPEKTNPTPRLGPEEESMRYSLDGNHEDRLLFMQMIQEALHQDILNTRGSDVRKVVRAFDFNKNFKDVGDVNPNFGASSLHVFGTPSFGNVPGGKWIFIPEEPGRRDEESAELLKTLTASGHSHDTVERPRSPDSTGVGGSHKKLNPWGLITEEDIQKGRAPDAPVQHTPGSSDAYVSVDSKDQSSFEIPFFTLEEPPESPEADDLWDDSIYTDLGLENLSERSLTDSGTVDRRRRNRIKDERKSLLLDYSTEHTHNHQHHDRRGSDKKIADDDSIFTLVSMMGNEEKAAKEWKLKNKRVVPDHTDLLLEQSSTFSEKLLKEREKHRPVTTDEDILLEDSEIITDRMSDLSSSGKKEVRFSRQIIDNESETDMQREQGKDEAQREAPPVSGTSDDTRTPVAAIVSHRIKEVDRQLRKAYAKLEESEVAKRKLVQQLSFLRLLEMEAGELQALERIVNSTVPNEEDVQILDRVIDRMRYRKQTFK